MDQLLGCQVVKRLTGGLTIYLRDFIYNFRLGDLNSILMTNTHITPTDLTGLLEMNI